MGLLAGASLLVMPGVWLAFSGPTRDLSWTERLAVAVAVSPVIVALQLYVLRFAGLSFEQASVALPFVNALSIPMLWRGIRRAPVSVETAAFVLTTLALAMFVAIPYLTSGPRRIFMSHTWMQTPIVYQIAGGALRPEEPDLAGIDLAYPWLPHAFWATGSWLTGWGPTRYYGLANLAALFSLAAFVYAICRLLGARAWSACVALAWMALGTNVIGFVLMKSTGWLPGDIRYTPFLRKFTTFEATPLALSLLGAVIFLAVRVVGRQDRGLLRLTGVLMIALAAFYPLMAVVALGVGCGLTAVLWSDRARDSPARQRYLESLAWLVCAVVATAAFSMLFAGGSTGSLITLSSAEAILSKVASSAIVLAPFLVASGICYRRFGLGLEGRVLIVTVAASLSAMAFWTLTVGHLEYKFMFAAAMALAPLGARLLDPWTRSTYSGPAIVAVSFVLLGPMYVSARGDLEAAVPDVSDAAFLPRVEPQPAFEWANAILRNTPTDTILVVDSPAVYPPGLVGRSLYAPVARKTYPGYWFEHAFYLVEERGYDRELLADRQSVTRLIFETLDGDAAARALGEIAALHRPIAILFEQGKGAACLRWLRRHRQGHALYSDDGGTTVWFLPPAGA